MARNSSSVYILIHGREEWVLYSLVPDYLSVSCDYEAMSTSFDTVTNLSITDALSWIFGNIRRLTQLAKLRFLMLQ